MHHDIVHDFPDLKQALFALKASDDQFKGMFQKYEAISNGLRQAQGGAGVMSEQYVTAMRQQRQSLKTDLFLMLKMKQATDASCRRKVFAAQ